MVDGLDDAIAASSTLRDDENGRFARLRRSFHLDGDDADLLLLSLAPKFPLAMVRFLRI